LDSVVVANPPLFRSTHFHELFHVVQCQILGVDLFGQRYLLEYVSHRYDSMPLEQLAVDLAHGYETREKFSVEEFLFDALKMLGLGRPSGSSRVSLGQQASSRGARRELGL
jgi:hypothetical protein